mmetsp:Transcript_102476/g.290210  ORF Transcript_102476/g.290210 Transcript_102476/m.290210 type:complete len:231 (-) Transcript_102476:113-805(-)
MLDAKSPPTPTQPWGHQLAASSLNACSLKRASRSEAMVAWGSLSSTKSVSPVPSCRPTVSKLPRVLSVPHLPSLRGVARPSDRFFVDASKVGLRGVEKSGWTVAGDGCGSGPPGVVVPPCGGAGGGPGPSAAASSGPAPSGGNWAGATTPPRRPEDSCGPAARLALGAALRGGTQMVLYSSLSDRIVSKNSRMLSIGTCCNNSSMRACLRVCVLVGEASTIEKLDSPSSC